MQKAYGVAKDSGCRVHIHPILEVVICGECSERCKNNQRGKMCGGCVMRRPWAPLGDCYQVQICDECRKKAYGDNINVNHCPKCCPPELLEQARAKVLRPLKPKLIESIHWSTSAASNWMNAQARQNRTLTAFHSKIHHFVMKQYEHPKKGMHFSRKTVTKSCTMRQRDS